MYYVCVLPCTVRTLAHAGALFVCGYMMYMCVCTSHGTCANHKWLEIRMKLQRNLIVTSHAWKIG